MAFMSAASAGRMKPALREPRFPVPSTHFRHLIRKSYRSLVKIHYSMLRCAAASCASWHAEVSAYAVTVKSLHTVFRNVVPNTQLGT